MKRRDVLTWTVRATGALVAGIVGIPSLLSALKPSLSKKDDPEWARLGEAGGYSLGQMEKAQIDNLSVYVWHKEDGNFVVYSRACTDLGCPVKYDKGSEWFYCPCHGGIFDKEGQRKAGPPPRPLWRYSTRIFEGYLEIDLNSVPTVAKGL